MKTSKHILFILLSVFILTSCSKDEDSDPRPVEPVKTVLVKDLAADPVSRDPNTGEVIGGTNRYTLFRFSDSTIVSNSDSASSNWDIAFRGTSIILNSHVSGPGSVTGQVVSSTLDAIVSAPESNYRSDSSSGNVFDDWYNYNMQTHIISPKPGYIFVIHTHDNQYVKMEILSYYKGAPSSPSLQDASRYYTFRFVYQPNGSRTFGTDN